MKTILTVLVVTMLAAGPALAAGGGARGGGSGKSGGDDVRNKCREAIQKSNGQGKDAKVSRKAIDRCVENGGQY